MNTASELERLEQVIDTSGVAPRLELLLPVGVRPRQLRVRTLLAGMLLIAVHGRPAHLRRVHHALLDLPHPDQQRLGILAQWKTGPHLDLPADRGHFELVQDLHPNDRGTNGTHHGATCSAEKTLGRSGKRAKAQNMIRETGVTLGPAERDEWTEEIAAAKRSDMQDTLERKVAVHREIEAELREAAGFDRVEGNPRRPPAGPPSDGNGGVDLLKIMGIDVELLDSMKRPNGQWSVWR